VNKGFSVRLNTECR